MTAEAQCLLCHRKHKAHGLCKMHHWAWCLAGHPELAAFIAERKTRPRTRLPRSPRYCVICGRKHQAHGLCAAHVCRWNAANRPALAAFIAAQRKGPPIGQLRGRGPCLICGRNSKGHGLCPAHRQRWRTAGRPNLDRFIAAQRKGPPIGQLPRPPRYCVICGRKHQAHGLCPAHWERWRTAGRPNLDRFIAAQRKGPPIGQLPRPPRYCVICGRKHQAHGLCIAHVCRWNAANRPDLAAFIAAQRKGPPIRRRRSDAGPCYVCGRPAIGCQLCRPHYPRWRRAGRPRLDLFALSERTAPSPPPRPTAQAPPCHLCGRPGRTRGLCGSHYSMWLQARRPPLDDFIETHSARRALQSAGILQTLIERNPTT